jgi:hypothetical protein
MLVIQDRDPIQFWQCYMATEAAGLAQLSIYLFKIVVNEAGCERVFSFLKEESKDWRNRLGLQKLEKMTKVCLLLVFRCLMTVLS